MFIKRQLAIIVMMSMGFLALSGYFLNFPTLREFTDRDAPQWYMIIAGFAAFLGCLNLLQMHIGKVVRKQKNWQYSIFTLLGFLIMIFFGFIYKGVPSGDTYIDSNNNNKYDYAETVDVGNGIYDKNEKFEDRNGIYDEGEKFIDLNLNGVYDKWKWYKFWIKSEDYFDTIGNGVYDSWKWYKFWKPAEVFIDEPDGIFLSAEEYTDDDGNGEYTPEMLWSTVLKTEGSSFYWMYNYIYLPLGSTMFALLAFFVASASYRAFRIRNFEATLLLISGVLLMLGRVPVGAIIPWWVVMFIYISLIFAMIASKIKNKKIFFSSYVSSIIVGLAIGVKFQWYLSAPLFLSIPSIQEWIMAVPATAGSRAIMIGIALGIVAQSFRIMTGRERSILGD